MFFSVAPQRAVDPISQIVVEFSVDPKDSALCYLRIDLPDGEGDYLKLTFRRQGNLVSSEMVDIDVVRDEKERRAAELRLKNVAPTPEQEDQLARDQELLDSPPKESKYAVDGVVPVTKVNQVTPADLHEARTLGYPLPGEQVVSPVHGVINTAGAPATAPKQQLGSEEEKQAAAGGESLGIRADDANNPPAPAPIPPAPPPLRPDVDPPRRP